MYSIKDQYLTLTITLCKIVHFQIEKFKNNDRYSKNMVIIPYPLSLLCNANAPNFQFLPSQQPQPQLPWIQRNTNPNQTALLPNWNEDCDGDGDDGVESILLCQRSLKIRFRFRCWTNGCGDEGIETNTEGSSGWNTYRAWIQKGKLLYFTTFMVYCLGIND